MSHRHCLALATLLCTAVPAQTPDAPRARGVPAPAQALIDEFIKVMPMDPTQLRQPAVRKELAPKVLPVLRRIREFAAENKETILGERVHEFVVYALVLEEPDLREALGKRGKDGDREALLLVRSADVIKAADAESRGQAVAACATALRAKPAEGTEGKALEAKVASCAVHCLVTVAELSEAEAKQLAAGGADQASVERLQAAAARAARDPRKLLDKPFEIEGTLLGGKSFRTGSLKGKVVLIDFWATWCVPCVRKLPELVRVQGEHREGLAIVGISCDREEAKLKTFLAEHPEIDWPQLYAGDGNRWHPLATQYGVEGIPRLFLVDKKGVLRSVDVKEDLAALVRRYIAE